MIGARPLAIPLAAVVAAAAVACGPTRIADRMCA